MSKTYAAITMGSLAGAIYFYNDHAFYSLLCFALFGFCVYATGRIF